MVTCGSYIFEFSVDQQTTIKYHRLQQTRGQRVGRWGAIPEITSPMKSMFHRKGGGSKKSSGTFMSNINYQGIGK